MDALLSPTSPPESPAANVASAETVCFCVSSSSLAGNVVKRCGFARIGFFPCVFGLLQIRCVGVIELLLRGVGGANIALGAGNIGDLITNLAYQLRLLQTLLLFLFIENRGERLVMARLLRRAREKELSKAQTCATKTGHIIKKEGKERMSVSKLASSAQGLQSSAIRELLKHSKMAGVISLGGGIPNPQLFDHEGLKIAADAVLSQHFGEAFQYGLTEGVPGLREEIQRICEGRGIACKADDVVITSGSQQSLDVLARALINPGDIVVVERPTYLAALQVFGLAQAQFESVGTDGDGMNVDELEALVANKTIKAVYIVPTFGNPGGVTLSEVRRKQLVELSKRYDFVIIEDDPYSEINYTEEVFRPLIAHAKDIGNEDNVVYTSTFSKILAPGTRVGWVLVPEWLKRAVVNLKQTTDLHTSTLSQLMTYEYLKTGRLAGQITMIREAYRQKYQTFASELEAELGDVMSFHKPKGGMFLWAKMNNGINTTKWLEKTLSNGVVFVPGEFFYCNDPDHTTLRMSFVTPTDEQLKEAVRRLKASL